MQNLHHGYFEFFTSGMHANEGFQSFLWYNSRGTTASPKIRTFQYIFKEIQIKFKSGPWPPCQRNSTTEQDFELDMFQYIVSNIWSLIFFICNIMNIWSPEPKCPLSPCSRSIQAWIINDRFMFVICKPRRVPYLAHSCIFVDSLVLVLVLRSV